MSAPTPADEPEKKDETSFVETLTPGFYLRMTEGMPIVVKQFLMLALLIAWPFFAATAIVFKLLELIFTPVLMLLFWPLRRYLTRDERRDSGQSPGPR